MKKKVLFISVSFMSLYKDIINELEKQGYDVIYMQDIHFPRNGFDINKRKPLYIELYRQSFKHKKYWRKQIREHNIDFVFDYLLVIDGFSLVNSGFLDFLEKKNPNIKKVLYLFDRTHNNYRFDLLFKSFDKIYSFDQLDCKLFGLTLLPIYWVPTSSNIKKIDIFGFGTYMPNRYILFNYVENLTRDTHLKTYIKLYMKEIPNTLKYKLRKLIKGSWYPESVYNSSLSTNKTIPPSIFRSMLSEARIVLDTHDVVQDGLTARFMWALGAGSKIITTNKSVMDYPFFDENQIAIFDIDHPFITKDFLTTGCEIDINKKSIIDQYRIDNWIKTLLSI